MTTMERRGYQMTAKTVDEVLHDFAITYKVESADTRKQDIDTAKSALRTIVLGCLGEDEEARYHSLMGCER